MTSTTDWTTEWFTSRRQAEAACIRLERKGYQTILRYVPTGNDLNWQVYASR